MEKTKNEIRKEYLKIRKSMDSDLVNFLSETICKTIISSKMYIEAEYILLYSAYNNEVITDLIALKAFNDGKKVFYPKVTDDYMNFYRVYHLDELKAGYMGIKEPDADNILMYKDSDNTLIIMPLAVYDKFGHRIGYGGGYYDKYLTSHKIKTKLGIAYSIQEYSEIPNDYFDVNVDYIINENEVIKI